MYSGFRPNRMRQQLVAATACCQITSELLHNTEVLGTSFSHHELLS